jgi:AI-2 transport protein TqsA
MEPWEKMEDNLTVIRRILGYFFFFFVVFLMWLLKKLLIPFVVAIFFALLLLPFLTWLIRKGVPKILSIMAAGLLLFLIAFMVGFLISVSAKTMANDYQSIEVAFDAQADKLMKSVSETFNLDLENQNIIETMFGGDLLSVLFKSTTGFALRMTNFTADFVIMMIYLFAILGGLTNYEKYLDFLEGQDKKEGGDKLLLKLFNEIQISLSGFMRIKFLASLATGIGYGLLAYFFGVKYAFLIGFIAFSLNFIPTIGSAIATLPPALLALFTIDSLVVYFVFLGLLLVVQFTVGNIIEPRFQGDNLGINFMTIILGLVFFGYLWGILGMLMSVPMLVLFRVILQQLPGAGWVVRLMSPYKEIKEIIKSEADPTKVNV